MATAEKEMEKLIGDSKLCFLISFDNKIKPENAGTKIILAEKTSGEHRIVLAKWRNSFVTWFYNTMDEAFSLGHYFQTIDEAVVDFNKRA